MRIDKSRLATTAVASLIALLAAGACARRVNAPRIVPMPDEATRTTLELRVQELMRAVPVATFEPGSFTAADGTTIPYRLLRPAELTAGRTYPLVVLFHGSGSIGTDNVSQVGPFAKSWAVPAMRSRYPAFVVVPQFPARSAVYRDQASSATSSLHAGLALIDELLRTLPVDRQRVYAAGFSMGGSAVWNAVSLRPELFSAAVAVSGVPNTEALRHGHTRLLLIHGDADTENPFTATARAYEQVRSTRVDFWQYRGLEHDFPAELLLNTAIADWLFQAP